MRDIIGWFGGLAKTVAAILACVAFPCGVFASIWLIVGTAWVYVLRLFQCLSQTPDDLTLPLPMAYVHSFSIDSSTTVCPATMYNFSYGYVIFLGFVHSLRSSSLASCHLSTVFCIYHCHRLLFGLGVPGVCYSTRANTENRAEIAAIVRRLRGVTGV